MSPMSTSKHQSKSPAHAHQDPAARKPVGRRVIKLGTREVVTEGLVRPLFHDLFHHFMTVGWPRLFTTLLRSQFPLFALGWTIMHVIDEASPLSSDTAESLSNSKTMFVLSLSGTDENTGQTLMARGEYSSADIRWNSTFLDILEQAPDGTLHIDYSKFHDIEPLQGSDTAPPASGN